MMDAIILFKMVQFLSVTTNKNVDEDMDNKENPKLLTGKHNFVEKVNLESYYNYKHLKFFVWAKTQLLSESTGAHKNPLLAPSELKLNGYY